MASNDVTCQRAPGVASTNEDIPFETAKPVCLGCKNTTVLTKEKLPSYTTRVLNSSSDNTLSFTNRLKIHTDTSSKLPAGPAVSECACPRPGPREFTASPEGLIDRLPRLSTKAQRYHTNREDPPHPGLPGGATPPPLRRPRPAFPPSLRAAAVLSFLFPGSPPLLPLLLSSLLSFPLSLALLCLLTLFPLYLFSSLPLIPFLPPPSSQSN